MCRHCERIKEDIESKPVVHAFMEHVAAGLTKRTGVLHAADDLDVEIHTVNRTIIRAVMEAKLKDPAIPGTITEDRMQSTDSFVAAAGRLMRSVDEAFGVPNRS